MISALQLPVTAVATALPGSVGAPEEGEAERPDNEFARVLGEAGAARSAARSAAQERPSDQATGAPKDAPQPRAVHAATEAAATGTAVVPARAGRVAGATRSAVPHASTHASAREPTTAAAVTIQDARRPSAEEDPAAGEEPHAHRTVHADIAGGAPEAAPTAADDTAALLAEWRALRAPRPGTAADEGGGPGLGAGKSAASVARASARVRSAEARPLADAPPQAPTDAATPALLQTFGGALAAAPTVDATAARADAGIPVAAMPSAGPAASSAASSVIPMAEGRLAAAPGSAEFATQLGAQLSTFVRGGVQHARLHLNPAELGPVTVQIQLDGLAAQVNLAAEHALTRQALEQSMPLLAGSLREAGLTLSGGGVFEQPRQPGDGAPGRPGGGTAGATVRDEGGAEAASTHAVTAPRRRGVVDLVA